MATVGDWVEGARLRTLPAAVAPVLAGTAVALHQHGARLAEALLCAVVALALQVGVNYANDYSDGVRGTDEARVGPARLVGGGLARPATVKAAAFGCFGLAAVAGLVLVLLTQQWWLLAVGVACILAAWFYTGGKHPYGYAGLGELFVFVFFGLVATCGTTYVQLGRVPAASVWAAVGIGMLACAILVANNLRDIPGDVVSGKRTLSVRIGDRGSRVLWTAMIVVSAVVLGVLAWLMTPWVLLALAFLLVLLPAFRAILGGARGPHLIPVLKATGIAELVWGLGVFLGAVLGR